MSDDEREPGGGGGAEQRDGGDVNELTSISCSQLNKKIPPGTGDVQMKTSSSYTHQINQC